MSHATAKQAQPINGASLTIINDGDLTYLKDARDRVSVVTLRRWTMSDLSALGDIPDLRRLTIHGANQLTAVDLTGFPKLQSVTLREVPKLEVVTFDEKLTSLSVLAIDGIDKRVDLAYVEAIPLKTLMLAHAEFADLTQLPKSVTEITCYNVEQVMLPTADVCPNLEVLDVSHSYLQDVPDWESYTKLRRFNLQGQTQEYINGSSDGWPDSLTHACLTRGGKLPAKVRDQQDSDTTRRLIVWG